MLLFKLCNQPDLLVGFKRCMILELVVLEIFYIEEGAFNQMDGLSTLNISYNALTSVNKQMWDGAPHIRYLDLR